jgi:hypothetical protein
MYWPISGPAVGMGAGSTVQIAMRAFPERPRAAKAACSSSAAS